MCSARLGKAKQLTSRRRASTTALANDGLSIRDICEHFSGELCREKAEGMQRLAEKAVTQRLA